MLLDVSTRNLHWSALLISFVSKTLCIKIKGSRLNDVTMILFPSCFFFGDNAPFEKSIRYRLRPVCQSLSFPYWPYYKLRLVALTEESLTLPIFKSPSRRHECRVFLSEDILSLLPNRVHTSFASKFWIQGDTEKCG